MAVVLGTCLPSSIRSDAANTRQQRGTTGFQRNPGSGSSTQQNSGKEQGSSVRQGGSGQQSNGRMHSSPEKQTSQQDQSSQQTSDRETSATTSNGKPLAVAGQIDPASIRASSVLPASSQSSYEAANVMDYDMATAWVENAAGIGKGEYLELSFPKGTIITAVRIMTGYHKNEDVFYKNAAPTGIVISSGSASQTLDLSRAADTFDQTLVLYSLDTPVVSDGSVRFEISSARPGSLWEDTCITEIHCLGIPAEDAGQWDVKNMVSIDLGAFYMLGDEAFRTASLFGKEVGGIGTTVYDPAKLSDADKAYLLNWYIYTASDPRILNNTIEWYNELSRDDLADIAEELLGDASEAIVDECISRYAERAEKGVVCFQSAGDFGDSGNWWFRQDEDANIENGVLKITGSIQYWDDESLAYIERGTFEAYYTEGGPAGTGGFRLQKVDVKMN